MIPRFDGLILSREWKDALWDKSSWKRHDYARRQNSNIAIAGFALRVEPGNRDQSKDRRQVAKEIIG